MWVWIWSRARRQQALRTWLPQSTLLMHLMVMTDSRRGGGGRKSGRETERNRGAVRGSVTWVEVHVSLQKHSAWVFLLRKVTDIRRYVNIMGSVLWLDRSGSHTLNTLLSHTGTQRHTQEIAGFSNTPQCFSSSWNNSGPVHFGWSLSLLFLTTSIGWQ